MYLKSWYAHARSQFTESDVNINGNRDRVNTKPTERFTGRGGTKQQVAYYSGFGVNLGISSFLTTNPSLSYSSCVD